MTCDYVKENKYEWCDMVLKNKLGITDPVQLAIEEERISKKKAIDLFDNAMLLDQLQKLDIHCHLLLFCGSCCHPQASF